MNRIYSLLTVMVLALTLPGARAEVVTNYSFDFSGLSTTAQDFAPSGWGHIVDSYFSTEDNESYYVSYTQKTSGGVDDSPCLYVGSQNVGSGWDTQEVNDMLVTPQVSGTVTLAVKKQVTTGSVKFYACTSSGSSFVKGDEITASYPDGVTELSTTDYTVLTITLTEPTYIGIRGNYVYVDNFTASQADVVQKREATLSSIKVTPSSKAVADADGNVTITVSGTLTNSGDVTLNPGDADYSVAVYDNSSSTAYTAVPVSVALAPGESTSVSASAVIPVTEKYRHRFDLKENVSGTSAYGGWIDVYPHIAQFKFGLGSAGNTIESGAFIDFGLTQNSDVEQNLYIVNSEGGADLNVSNVSVPAGFNISIKLDETDAVATSEFPFVVPALKRAILTVTMDHEVVGARFGEIVISAEGFEDAVFAVSGSVLDPTKFYETFESGNVPAGSLVEYNGSSKAWKVGTHSYAKTKALANGLIDPESKFILPKMTFTEDDILAFDAAARSSNSTLNVYISADRKNFTLLKSLSYSAEDARDKLSNDRYSTSSYNDSYKFTSFFLSVPVGDWYVAFGAGYSWIDNVVGGTVLPLPENETVLHGVTIPTEATCNHTYSISGKFFNLTAQNFAAGEYEARFYLSDGLEATAPIPATAASEASSFTLNVTPHDAGTWLARLDIVKVADGTIVNFQKETQVVAGEVVSGTQQVGTPTGTAGTAPVVGNYKNSNSETVYKASDINLAAGTAIHGLFYKGYNTSADWPIHLSVYMQNTTDETPNTTEMSDVSGMTLVYDGDYTIKKEGSSSELAKMIDLSFAEDFIYTGGNVRIVCVSRSDIYKWVNFEHAKNVSTQTYRQQWDGSTPGTWSSATMPVVHFYIDKEPTTLSGVVTDGTNPVEGVEVKVQDGEVYYDGTTDAEGKYSFVIYQDQRSYAFTATKTGYFNYADSVSFTGKSIVKNVVLQNAAGFNIVSTNVPATGEVNSPLTVTAQLLNGVEKAADSYTAELYVADQLVATAETPALADNTAADFTFTFTPHAAGDMEAYVKFTVGDFVAQSEGDTIAIAEEAASSFKQVGDHNKFDRSGPVNVYFKNSKTELIYRKADINLAPGTPIKSVKFKGYVSSTKASETYTYNGWVSNEAEGATFNGGSSEDMTQIMANRVETYTEIKGSADEPVDILTIEMPEGFKYEGGDLRFYLTCEGTAYHSGVYFEISSITDQAKQGRSDSKALNELTPDTKINLPVLYIGVDPKRTISGRVYNIYSQSVAGAKVTLKNGDVEYYGTTDKYGNYSVDVIKYGYDYAMSVTADMYAEWTDSVSFANGNVSQDVCLQLAEGYFCVSGYVTLNGESVADHTVRLLKDGVEVEQKTTNKLGIYWFGPYAIGTENWEIDFGPSTVSINFETMDGGTIQMNYELSEHTGVASVGAAKGIDAYGIAGAIVVKASDATTVNVYNAAGALVRSVAVESGDTRLEHFTPGIYIVNKAKVVVR